MAPIKPRPPRRKSPPITSITAWCRRTWTHTQTFAQRNSRFTGLLLAALLLSLFLIFATLLPSTQPCEGNLILKNLDFESTQAQPLLQNTPSLNQITLIGKVPLRLSGQFSNNPALKEQSLLQLDPIDETATLQITALPQASLELIDLFLEPKTQVKQLSYDTYNKRLKFNLKNHRNTHLSLNLNGSFSVQLNGYTLPSQSIFSPDLSFTWEPDNQLDLILSNSTDLDLKFTDFIEHPFRGRLSVTSVKLDSPNVRTQDYNLQYLESSILAGSVRLADKNYNLEANQFLNFIPSNSIDTLLDLSLSEENTDFKISESQTLKLDKSIPGIKLNFSGKTKRIEIGLNPKNPVAQLQASLLEAWMPRDAVIGLIAFLSTLVMTLIGWLWEIATDDSSP